MALGSGTFNAIGGAVSDLFAADAYRYKASADRLKAQGQRMEAGLYDEAAGFSRQNIEFTKSATEIKQLQIDRSIQQTLGGQRADVAASGFAQSGTAIDLLRDSASQGALTRAVAGQQGEIEEMGYEQQAKSYDTMASVSRISAQASEEAALADEHAGRGAQWSAGFKIAGAVASLFL